VDVMRELGVCAATVTMIAKRFDVSTNAAARRIVQLLPYEIGVCVWRLSSDDALLAPSWYVSKKGPLSLEYAIPLGAAGSECFADQPVRGWRWLPLQGQMDRYFVDVSPLGDTRSWIVVVIFDSAAEQILNFIGRGQLSEGDHQYGLLE
jgi:hypothetical protein